MYAVIVENKTHTPSMGEHIVLIVRKSKCLQRERLDKTQKRGKKCLKDTDKCKTAMRKNIGVNYVVSHCRKAIITSGVYAAVRGKHKQLKKAVKKSMVFQTYEGKMEFVICAINILLCKVRGYAKSVTIIGCR